MFDVKTDTLLKEVRKNIAKTFATISPDNNIIISGDEDGHRFILGINQGKIIKQLDASYNESLNINFNKIYKRDYQNGININDYVGSIATIKFIDKSHFMIFM